MGIRTSVRSLIIRMVEATLRWLCHLVLISPHRRKHLDGVLAILEYDELRRSSEILVRYEPLMDPLGIVFAAAFIRVAPVNPILDELVIFGKGGLASFLPNLGIGGPVEQRPLERIPKLVRLLERLHHRGNEVGDSLPFERALPELVESV